MASVIALLRGALGLTVPTILHGGRASAQGLHEALLASLKERRPTKIHSVHWGIETATQRPRRHRSVVMKIAKSLGMLLLVCACLLSPARGQSTPMPVAAPHAAPVNPDATREARELLKKVDQIPGHFTLTGQYNFPNHVPVIDIRFSVTSLSANFRRNSRVGCTPPARGDHIDATEALSKNPNSAELGLVLDHADCQGRQNYDHRASLLF